MSYDDYNREERALCSHLFRLLHERLSNNPEQSALWKIVDLLVRKGVKIYDGVGFHPFTREIVGKAKIYTEVALIRDAYYEKGPSDRIDFTDRLVKLVADRQCVSSYRLYSQLPKALQTYPGRILLKENGGESKQFTEKEEMLYKTIREMFYAKPDLAISIGNCLIVLEAKFTTRFNNAQMMRTQYVTEAWAKLLYKDLGYVCEPSYVTLKLGLEKAGADLSWEEIYDVASQYYSEHDRTRKCLSAALKLSNKGGNVS